MENDKLKNIQERDSSSKVDSLQIWTETVIAQKIGGFRVRSMLSYSIDTSSSYSSHPRALIQCILKHTAITQPRKEMCGISDWVYSPEDLILVQVQSRSALSPCSCFRKGWGLPLHSSFGYDWTCSACTIEDISKSMFAGLWCAWTIILRRPKPLWGLSSPTFNRQPCCGFGSWESVQWHSNSLTPHNLFFQNRKEVCVYLKNNRNTMPKFCVVSHLYKYKSSKLSGCIECHLSSPFLPVLGRMKSVHTPLEEASLISILTWLHVSRLKT